MTEILAAAAALGWIVAAALFGFWRGERARAATLAGVLDSMPRPVVGAWAQAAGPIPPGSPPAEPASPARLTPGVNEAIEATAKQLKDRRPGINDETARRIATRMVMWTEAP